MGILIYTMSLLNYLIRSSLYNTLNLILGRYQRITFRFKGVQSGSITLIGDRLVRELLIIYPK